MRFISLCLAAMLWLCLGLSSTGRAAEPASTASSHELAASDLDPWLDGFFPAALKQADIAGAVVIVVRDGQVVAQKGYGWADLKRRVPMDPQRTVLAVGSVSKLFTWTAVMQQVELGRLDLDADINRYLDFKIPPYQGKPVTLRNLMTHSAGFSERSFKTVPDGQTPRGLGAYLKGTPVPVRIYAPGTTPAYSNYGAMLGGYIVERVSGEAFPAYVERHILTPLGMARSSFRRPPPVALRGDLAQSYRLASQGEPTPIDNEEPLGDPSGHLNTTAADISRFMIAHLDQGGVLLQPQTAARMQTLAFQPWPVVKGMTLGFFRMDRNGRRIIGHPGDILSFHSDLLLLPEQRTGVFIALNSDGTPNGVLSASNAVRSTFEDLFMDRYFPATPTPEPPTVATAAAHARMAAGEYELSQAPGPTFQRAVMMAARAFMLKDVVTANPDGTITTAPFLSFETGRAQTWREVAPFVWREVGGDAELRMRVQDGRVTAFSSSDLIAAFMSLRVPTWRSAALNMPLLLAAIGVIGLSLVSWPVTALVRRFYGRRLPAPGRERVAANLAAVLVLIYLTAWAFALSGASQVGFAPWIRCVQAIGLLCVIGAGAGLWNAWRTVSGAAPWWSKLWSVLLALALVEIVWFSFAFHLISASLNY